MNGHSTVEGISSSSTKKYDPQTGTYNAIDVALRKKYGTKFANFLSSAYKIEKKKNQEVTSKVEKKILVSFQSSSDRYKETFKILCRLLKVIQNYSILL